MKVTYLKIKNIGMIADQKLALDKPLIILYGEVRQGKSTILNCVRWVLGGSVPTDLIRHGAKEASIEMGFEGGSVSRSFYRSKTGEVTARSVEFVRDGVAVRKPAAEIQKFLNPFLLDQDHLRNMNEPARKAFFTELFGVDTKELDIEAAAAAKEASELRAKVRGYGDLDLTTVTKPDVEALNKERQTILEEHAKNVEKANAQIAEIKAEYRQQVKEVNEANANVANRHHSRETAQHSINSEKVRILEFEGTIKKLRLHIQNQEEWLQANPELELVELPAEPEFPATPSVYTAEVDAKIAQAKADEVRFENYQKALARDKQRQTDEAKVLELERRQKAIKEEKAKKLKGISEQSGVPGLTFDEEGNFLYEDTQAGMLSTSQLMRLSSALSGLYPEGFGIELLDRGESLGRAIFDYVKHAEEHKTTVLATVVGQRPAQVPEHVGVFVVKDGVVLDGVEPESTK